MKKKPMQYTNIVFLQDSEAEEALNILEHKGEEATFDHLMQWHTGEEYIETLGEHNSIFGTHDRVYRRGNFAMAYNLGCGYIGLTEFID